VRAAARELAAPSQLIHGDLTGNVLFDDQLPPAIIDFSAHWRPVPYVAAIVVADALIFRIATDCIVAGDQPRHAHSGGHDPWTHAVDLASQLAAEAGTS
jgi:hypothetical protein